MSLEAYVARTVFSYSVSFFFQLVECGLAKIIVVLVLHELFFELVECNDVFF
jgi:hypothetical protein